MTNYSRLLLVLGVTVVAAVWSGCFFRERLRTVQVIENTRKIRNAELDFRQIERRYASLKELNVAGLVDKSLGSGSEGGYVYDLTAEKESYSLSVYEDPSQYSESQKPFNQLSLFLDETGIIRCGVYPDKRADATSEPIRPKDWMARP